MVGVGIIGVGLRLDGLKIGIRLMLRLRLRLGLRS